VRNDTEVGTFSEARLAALLADAGRFMQASLWESPTGRGARDALADRGVSKRVAKSFGVGWAPVSASELMDHLDSLGYSTEEVVAAGLATLSVRGRAHAHFRSRLMFPVKDRRGRIRGFAGLGMHVGPSWALWVTSPDAGPYRRSEAVFGLDRAAKQVAASGTAVLVADCVEVLRAHQEGRRNSVAVHTGAVTREQMLALSSGIKGGLGALKLELPPGMEAESKRKPAVLDAAPRSNGRRVDPAPRPRHRFKRLLLVGATSLVATLAWTGAPLLAVWAGSQAQGGQVVGMRGVITVLVVIMVLEILLAAVLLWLSRRYDDLTGRPRLATETSPWHRAKRGDRVQDIRSRYGVSPPEKVVALSVGAAVLALQVWFFLFAGSPFGS
jgi:hypothetical protein